MTKKTFATLDENPCFKYYINTSDKTKGQGKVAGVVQLVECFLAKEEVVGSNPIARSDSRSKLSGFFIFLQSTSAFHLYIDAQRRISGSMPYELLSLINLDPDEDIQSSLRLALMFKEEVDEATRAYMEMLQITMESSDHSQEEITQMVQETINAAIITGIRAYRSWIQKQGINVQAVEENSGKDIPPDFFHKEAHWLH